MEYMRDKFGCLVFDDRKMKERLAEDTYRSFKESVNESKPIEKEVAKEIAEAMKQWAIENGATHFSHWFQPMTGITAEKHDSFIQPGESGNVILSFSYKELIKGEPDASSFPSGGLRSTFEARGYTDWDPTSYAFIKGHTLCIPTAFASYTGEALDQKTPLLRSMEVINKEALRILRLFGNTTSKKVITSVGAEQEYFLISREKYLKRPDLIYTGRTLFGARPSKGQEMDDHYFGALKPKVEKFMEDLNDELWKLGVLAKTEHNEAAPAQHELAPIYSTTNIATDHNQLTMEIMQTVAYNHGLKCLLHEKPFYGVNGSGKHNNWSICTDDGINLLKPGKKPSEDLSFLLFLVAVIKAVDEYAGLLRYSVATASNDNRLGGYEAPPAIISIFLGDELEAVLEAIRQDIPYDEIGKIYMDLGAESLPNFRKDNTDRNRTSPFAFTGNKFEFRSLGSKSSIATCNVVLNTIVAEVLKGFADELEGKENFEEAVKALIKQTYEEHRRVVFNGDGYSESWVEEAERRGLPNIKTTPECYAVLKDEKNRKVLTDFKVLTEKEIDARAEIMLENYIKTINIETNEMISMAKKFFIPAIEKYMKDLSKVAVQKKELDIDNSLEVKLIKQETELTKKILEVNEKLESQEVRAEAMYELLEQAMFIKDEVLPLMSDLRMYVDAAESITAKEYWPFPSYGDLLFEI